MRIIAGSLKGRIFEAPTSNKTHPASERIRNALFNALGDVSGLTLFDAFGGSGAIAFEAVSRGAKEAFITENDKKAAKTIQANIQTLGIEDKVHFSQANCFSWLKQAALKFDLIVADPPFKKVEKVDLASFCNYLTKDGLLMHLRPKNSSTPNTQGLTLIKQQVYGAACLSYYRLNDSKAN